MYVVDDGDQRTLPGRPLEQPAHSPERLVCLDRLLRSADCGKHSRRDRLGVRVTAEQIDEPILQIATTELGNDLSNRMIADALTVGQAVPYDRDDVIRLESRKELSGEA